MDSSVLIRILGQTVSVQQQLLQHAHLPIASSSRSRSCILDEIARVESIERKSTGHSLRASAGLRCSGQEPHSTVIVASKLPALRSVPELELALFSYSSPI